MGRTGVELSVILALLLANGVFAMAEVAVLSSRKVRLRRLAASGGAGAEAALDLALSPGPFLATVQVGITLVGILAGAFGGATVAEDLAARLEPLPVIGPWADGIAFAVVVLGVAYAGLILGELVPKRIALGRPEHVAGLLARPMRALSRLAAPAVWLLEGSTSLVLKLLRVRAGAEPAITHEEVRLLVRQGAHGGIFRAGEQVILERVLRLGTTRAGSLMTPRVQVVALDVEDGPEKLRRTLEASPHSRHPIVEGGMDHVVGVVRSKDLLVQVLGGARVEVRSAMRRPLFVPETTSALNLLELFRRHATHLAVVIDEHGGMQGIVTHGDVLEMLVGELPPEGGTAWRSITRLEGGGLMVDGMLPIGAFKEALGLPELPDEEEAGYATVAGFVSDRLGAVPQEGQSFEHAGWRFEIKSMEGLRVDEVLVTPLAAPERDAAG